MAARASYTQNGQQPYRIAYSNWPFSFFLLQEIIATCVIVYGFTAFVLVTLDGLCWLHHFGSTFFFLVFFWSIDRIVLRALAFGRLVTLFRSLSAINVISAASCNFHSAVNYNFEAQRIHPHTETRSQKWIKSLIQLRCVFGLEAIEKWD